MSYRVPKRRRKVRRVEGSAVTQRASNSFSPNSTTCTNRSMRPANPSDSSNDLTAQLCKCIFLKIHMERHRDYRAEAGGPLLMEIFQAEYITEHGQKAVEEIKKAFATARSLAEYNFVDDRGHSFEIFDRDDFY